MKKMLILLGLSLLVCSLVAEDFMQPAQVAKDSYYSGIRYGVRNVSRDQDPAPEYSFIPNGDDENTTYLTSSYYDYMPFSYNGHNLRSQPETSQPYGFPAGGMYVTYMRSETQNVIEDRRAYFSYIKPDGTLGESNAINSAVNREGLTSLAIDPYTGDPFTVWHAKTAPSDIHDIYVSYAPYHATASAGAWRAPFILIDNPETSIELTEHDDDEFIWPQVWIGPSPEAGHRRVHAYGNNSTSNTAATPVANYNSLYMYADFDDEDLLYTSDLDWTIKSFPWMDDAHYNDIDRVIKDIIVSEVDGQVVFFGAYADSLMAMYSDDYGDTFTKYTQQLKQPMINPEWSTCDSVVWYDDDEQTIPSEMFIVPSGMLNHYNGIFIDDNTKVQWMCGVEYNSQNNLDTGYHYPAYIYPKIFTFDTITHDFSFYELDIQDTDPADDHLAVSWDLNDDDEVDEYWDDGSPVVPTSFPSWFFSTNTAAGYSDSFFHEANVKMVSNGNWAVCVWYDGAKHFNAFLEVEGYDGWLKQPEIALVISDDGGETWSDIRYINANPLDNVVDPVNHYDGNFAPELDGMLPVSISLGDELEILSNVPGNRHAKLNFVFMDDDDYGSAAGSTTAGGGFTNSALRYAAIDIDFSGNSSFDDVTVTPNADLLSQNYPNPFNPTTTIAFNMIEAGDVSIEVFNVKGQKVKTLINEHMVVGDHTLIWEGTNDSNQKVSSGIYFYKMKSANYSSTKKMILMK